MSTSSPSSASSMSLSPSLDPSSCAKGSLSKLGGDWTVSAGGGGGGAFFTIGLGVVVSTGATTVCAAGSVLGGGEDALEDAFEKFPGATSIFCFSNCWVSSDTFLAASSAADACSCVLLVGSSSACTLCNSTAVGLGGMGGGETTEGGCSCFACCAHLLFNAWKDCCSSSSILSMLSCCAGGRKREKRKSLKWCVSHFSAG